VLYNDENGGGECVACVVPHQHKRHGCVYSEHGTCYMCPFNPFYEVVRASDEESIRCTPAFVSERVIPVGTRFWLDLTCPEFVLLVKDSQLEHRRVNRKRKFAAMVQYDSMGLPIAPEDLVDEEVAQLESRFIEVWLDVPRWVNTRLFTLSWYYSYNSRDAGTSPRSMDWSMFQ
jgi:hypothetical protein